MNLTCVFVDVILHLCFAPQFVISFAITFDFTSTLGLTLCEIYYELQVEIDVEHNRIHVYNKGDGVPIEIHKEEGVYVLEMIFGHILTNNNYNDAKNKTTGGQNSYGAKLANIFFTEFSIETSNGR
jgi:DNA gyrase/topoisomerase IV subunit B